MNSVKLWHLSALLIAWTLVGCGDETTNTSSDTSTADTAEVSEGDVTGDTAADTPPEDTIEASCEDEAQNGDETGVDCGGSCDACADGEGCAEASDCASGVCESGSCAASSCSDSVQNGDETDSDCGGSCDACAAGEACGAPSDCASGVCESGSCATPSCSDSVQNGAETDTDCGGDVCEACAVGGACEDGGDCATGSCTEGACAEAACDDGAQNGDETDVDCGGSCDACADGAACLADEDCLSLACDDVGNLCVAAGCADGLQNGDETDVDCGGSCSGCPDGDACVEGTDCFNDVCTDGACAAPTCDDGAQNGDETGADCGGSCDPCADGVGCSINSDCVSGVCNSNNACAVPQCDDTVLNGDEGDTDCGGSSCDPCAVGRACNVGGDCAEGVCEADVCVDATCTDSVANGSETDVDCGGSCPEDCADGAGCAGPEDCLSGVCESGACAVPTCADSVANGSETDVDCGGSCDACAVGAGCAEASDCLTEYCGGDGLCAEPPSCAEIVSAGLSTGDGTYTIDPDGASGSVEPLEVTCDMTTDGGVGYTLLRIDDATNLVTGGGASDAQDAYRAACAAVGMEVIVPRTRAHAESIATFNGDAPPNLVGVYPQTNGARGLHSWEGRCQGQPCSFYLADSDSARCDNIEPSGDNNTEDALYRYATDPTTCEADYGSWNDANGAVQIGGYVLCSTNDAGPPVMQSCREIFTSKAYHNASADGINGPYTIDPDGDGGAAAALEVHCDFTADGGVGYTMLRVEDADLTLDGSPPQDAFRAACTDLGLEVIVPRTRDHAWAVANYNGGEPPNLVNVYPRTDGARGLHSWEGRCQGQPCSFYLADSDSARCANIEPSGDNTTDDALYRYATDPTTCTPDYGSWNDAPGNMSGGIAGYVVCSTNDAGPDTPRATCQGYMDTDTVWNVGPDGINGVYTIDPDGEGGADPYDVYCDQRYDGGGWTLLLSADGNSTYWGNNSLNWNLNTTEGTVPAALVEADFKSEAYNSLTTNTIKLCHADNTQCYGFPHNYGISMRDFFVDGITYDHYAFDIIGHANTGTAASRDAFIAATGFTGYWTVNTCFWLGINERAMSSGIGLMGDANGGCLSNASNSQIDDLAMGLGLQSCGDNNGCAPGGSDHLAGQSYGANGVADSGVFSPWFVFGK